MISNRTIRQWFRSQIDADGTISLDNFAWQNRTFDGSGKDLYFNERLAITQERITTNEESAKWGIMFYDAIVYKSSGTELQEDTAEILADIFRPAISKDIEIEPGLKINIDEATTGTASELEPDRVLLPVRIEFRAYETTA